MNIIRNIIRDVVTELFDNVQNIDYIQEKINDDYFCKFKIENVEYVVIFRLFKDIARMYAKDEKVRNVIESTKEKYYMDFGTFIDGNIDVKSETNLHNTSKVINAVSFIIWDFIIKNNIDIVAYFAESRRKKIYKYIFNKYLDKDFILYAQKIESDVIPVFYINKKLLNNDESV